LSSPEAGIESLLTNYAINLPKEATGVSFSKSHVRRMANETGLSTSARFTIQTVGDPDCVLVELYRYDIKKPSGPNQLSSRIDGLFNWAKHFVMEPAMTSRTSPHRLCELAESMIRVSHGLLFNFRNDAVRELTPTSAPRSPKTSTGAPQHMGHGL